MGPDIFKRIRSYWRLSFLLAIILSFVANIFNILGFVSPYWIVPIESVNNGFVRLGLWEVCFDNFPFPGDYISKAYDGCWYIFRQEFKYIRFWINPPWFIFVQVTSIVNITFSLGSLLLVLQNAAGVETKFCRLSNIPIIFLQSVVVACLTVVTIYMGLMSKDRMWLPFSDNNTVGWGIGCAATAGILTVLSIICLFVDQMAHYSEQIYHKLLEERGILSAQSLPPELTSGIDNLTHQPSIPPTGAPSESKLGGVPSLFMTGSLPSVGSRGERNAGPAARLGSAIGSAKSALLNRYGEAHTSIPGLAHRPQKPATSGALASAKLREDLKKQRPAEAPTEAGAAGAATGSQYNVQPGGSVYSLSLSGERPVIVHGTAQGTILKDSAV